MIAKNPRTLWYFNDWEDDKALKTCSLAAQGLWMRLLCIAARSPEPGIVQIGSRNSGLPHGLALIASAVGRPPEELAPLIDELLASGTASRDRRGRLLCRRMRDSAALSVKRAQAGRLGAAAVHGGASHGKERSIGTLPRQMPGNRAPPSRLPDFVTPPHGETVGDAAPASRSLAGAPPSRPGDGQVNGQGNGQGNGTANGIGAGPSGEAKWRERLEAFRPWEGKRPWLPFWGLPPDSAGTNPLIPAALLGAWRARAAAEFARLREPAAGDAGAKAAP
jgi:hypothetical protein